jgi:hypothetical protein
MYKITFVAHEIAQHFSFETFLGTFNHFHHFFFAAVLKDHMPDHVLLRTLAIKAEVTLYVYFPAGIFGVLATLRGPCINIWIFKSLSLRGLSLRF